LADVEETQLLCSLNPNARRHWATVKQVCLGLCIGSAWLVCAADDLDAQSASHEDEPIEYAPGSTGPITTPLMELHREGRALGDAWSQQVQPQEAPEGAFDGIDFNALRDDALNHPRVRALLNSGSDHTGEDGAGERYEGGRLFVLASFSMPRPSLRQLLEEANLYGVPVVFRGFVNSSVYETQDAIVETFGSLEDAKGFMIDPTVFQRLQVETVPLLIGAASSLDQCETPGCVDDPVPSHDVVRGNVPLKFALELMAERGAHASTAAEDALLAVDATRMGASQ